MDKDLNLWLRVRATRKQNTAYALADETLTILANNAAMNAWVAGACPACPEHHRGELVEGACPEVPPESVEGPVEGESDALVGRYLPEVFYELVGVEDLLRRMARERGETFTLPKIHRSSSDGPERYFDLQVEPLLEFGATLLVMITDVTEQALLERRLRQQRNELHLLHAQLDEANDRLTYLLHHFVPQEVAQRLIDAPQLPRPGGERRQATILFADARDFTVIAEALEPEQVLEVLNAHLSVISEAIRRHQGTLIQYVGDMVMAAFNVPDDQPDHPLRAVRAALDVRDSLERFAAGCQAACLPVLQFRIGLSTGAVVAGYQGTEYRYEYAALGDTTNVAYHICARAKADQILISQMTLERLDERAEVTPLGAVQLKRRREPLPVYELVGLAE